MKKRAGLLLVCALLAALLLSGCSGQKQAEYRADVQSGVSYLQSLETIDPDTVTQKLRQMRLEKLQAERAAREQALLDDIDTVWQEFSDAVILGDSRAVGFSYYSFLDASRVLASSGERIDAIDGHIEDLKKLDPAYIFLCYGINDLGWYGSAQDYADTLLEKIRLLRRELPEAVIVVSSILPAYEPAVSREKLWLQIPDYTAAVQAMCEENGVLFADNTQLSEDYADLWQPDGIHLLPEFYPHWAANLTFTVCGCRILRSSALAARIRMTTRETFSPPPVDPALAPTIMRSTRITRENSGHRSKFSVPKPVVVMTEETVKAA